MVRCWCRTNLRPVVIAPTGDPRFKDLGGETVVSLTMGVTNNTGWTISGNVTVMNPRSVNYPLVSFACFTLRPHSGKVCTVSYTTYYKGLVVECGYGKVRSRAEVKLRKALFDLGVPRITTNEDWHSVIVGQIVQR
jgi:hypothetical protein